MVIKIVLMDWTMALMGILALTTAFCAVYHKNYVLMLCAIILAVMVL